MAWEEEPVHKAWNHIWRKEYRVEALSGDIVVLNRLRNRLNFRVLKELCVELLPLHIYQSVFNYAKPWMVLEKAARAMWTEYDCMVYAHGSNIIGRYIHIMYRKYGACNIFLW